MSQVLYLSCKKRQEQIMGLFQVQLQDEQEEHQDTSQDDKYKRNTGSNKDYNGQESQDNKLHGP